MLVVGFRYGRRAACSFETVEEIPRIGFLQLTQILLTTSFVSGTQYVIGHASRKINDAPNVSKSDVSKKDRYEPNSEHFLNKSLLIFHLMLPEAGN